MNEVSFVVPLQPPSVNHYKKFDPRPSKRCPKGRWYVTSEAQAFLDAVCTFARGDQLRPLKRSERLKLSYRVYLGKDQSGDVDNFAKCIQDGLTRAGVIKSDAAIVDLYASKRRDWNNPRTEIHVSIITLEDL